MYISLNKKIASWFINSIDIKLAVGSVELDASHSKDIVKEEEQKTGHSTTNAAVDVAKTINSGRTDTSLTDMFNSGREDTSNSTTNNSGRIVNSGSTNTGTSSTSGSTNTSSTAARQNVTNSNSSTFNSGRTDTQQTILEQPAVDRLVAQILEGSQGLQATTSGQRTSGGYDSSTNMLLANDLVARTAGEVAVRGAKTVSTIGSSSSSTSGQQTENIGAIDTIQTIGGSTSNYENIIGGSSTDTNSTSSVHGINRIGATRSSSGTTNVQGESSSEVTNNVGARTTDTFNTAIARKEATNTTVAVKAKGGTILCTELLAQGKMDAMLHRHSHVRFHKKYSSVDRAGYYIWAVPLVCYIRKYPNGLVCKVTHRVVLGAVKCIAEFPAGHKLAPSTADKVIFHIGSLVCKLLSKTIARNFEFHTSMLENK